MNLLIVGIGNLLMGDEGIGVHIVRALEKLDLSDKIACLDGGTGNFTLLEPMQAADTVIIIDAVMDSKPLGTITHLTPQYSKDYPRTLTAHDIGLKDLLDVFYLLGNKPEVILYTVTIKDIKEMTDRLSPELDEQSPKYVNIIRDDAINLLSIHNPKNA